MGSYNIDSLFIHHYPDMKVDAETARRYILKKRKENDKDSSEMVKYYEECIDEYYQLIHLLSKFMDEFPIEENNILCGMILRYLIFKGYLSFDNQFQSDSKSDFHDVKYYEGLDVLTGNGVCRHVARIYHDLFQDLGIDTFFVPSYLSDNKMFLKNAIKKEANHVFNTVTYNDVLYGFDLFSNSIMKYKNGLESKQIVDPEDTEICGIIPFYCYYKPAVDVTNYQASIEQVSERINIFKSNSKKDSINHKEYWEFRRFANELLKHNSSILSDFKEEAKIYTKCFPQKMKNAKKSYISFKSDEFYRRY